MTSTHRTEDFPRGPRARLGNRSPSPSPPAHRRQLTPEET